MELSRRVVSGERNGNLGRTISAGLLAGRLRRRSLILMIPLAFNDASRRLPCTRVLRVPVLWNFALVAHSSARANLLARASRSSAELVAEICGLIALAPDD